MPELPDWIHNGAILGMQGGTESVLKDTFMKAPTCLLPRFGCKTGLAKENSFGKQLFWNWELDTDRYPGWSKMVSELKKEDVAL